MEKNLTITLGTKETTENMIKMLEAAVLAVSDRIEKEKPTTKVASAYTPSIKLSQIKRILFSERKYEPDQSLLIIFLKDGYQVPTTPISFFTIPQLQVFLNWLMTALSKEKAKLNLIK